jgi:ferredoxin
MAALKYINEKKITHLKISSINYDESKIQEYLTSPNFSDEDANLLFALGSRYVECRANVKNRYRDDDIQCQFCMQSCDTQCSVINKLIKSNMIEDDTAEYEDIICEVRKQKRVTVLFKNRIEIRKKLETDPSNSGEVLKNSFDILSSGK